MELRGITPILAAITHGVVLGTPDGRIQHANPAYAALVGCPPDALHGLPLSAYQGEHTDPDTARAIAEALAADVPFSAEVPLRQARATWADFHLAPIRAGSRRLGHIGMLRDISMRHAAEAERAIRDRLMQFLFDHVQAGLVLHAADSRILYANARAAELLGVASERVLGAQLADPRWLFVREDGSPMPQEEFPFARAIATRRVVSNLVLGQYRGSERDTVWVMCNAYPQLDAEGEPTEVVVSFTDITALKQAEQALKKSEERLSLVLRGANDAAWDWDLLADELYYSPRWWQMIGYAPGELPVDSTLWRRCMHPEDAPRVAAELDAMLAGSTTSYEIEFRLHHRDGHYVPVLSRGFILRDGQGRPTRISGANTDLSERKRAEKRIHHLAHYDALTGLPNRRLLMERLAQVVHRPAGERECEYEYGAMLFIDVDNFKLLNDTMGHAVGDQLLKQVTRRLHACVRQRDMLARLGGDEFIALLEGLGNERDAAVQRASDVAQKIRDVLSLPYTLGRIDYRCTVSIGIAMIDDSERTAEAALRHADLAMYQAKAGGKNTLRVFDHSMQVAVRHRLALEHDLREDLQARRLELYYQPQVDSEGRTVSAEVLLRWRHRTRGMVPPAEFIPIAEATGLILPLGQWVLDSACRQIAAWAADPLTAGLSLSVNASVRQFHEPGFVAGVLAALNRSGADPSRLVIEVTESLFAENIECVIATMARLRAHGVCFALDDFGTGYSSLSYLQRMPLDEIKVDRAFVHDIQHGTPGATITRMVLSLAENLGIKAVAEGVETPAELAYLAQLGCRHYQGHLFAPAMPLADFEQHLAGHPRPSAICS